MYNDEQAGGVQGTVGEGEGEGEISNRGGQAMVDLGLRTPRSILSDK